MSEGRGTKVARGRRLAWYAVEADEDHWHGHWSAKVSEKYFATAREPGALRRNELGEVLLEVFSRSGRLLEAGCGAGWYVAALQTEGYDVEGIEYSKELVDLVNEQEPDLPVRWADATDLDEPDGSYSGYLSIGVVEHVESGPQPFFAEAMRLLEPGGRAVFTVPSFGPLRRFKARLGLYARTPPDEPFFQYGFTAEEFGALVRDAGFRIDQVGYQGAYRLLVEEVPGYWNFTMQRGGHRARKVLDRIIGTRDGHMVLVVATKPHPG